MGLNVTPLTKNKKDAVETSYLLKEITTASKIINPSSRFYELRSLEQPLLLDTHP